jgi:two-component system, LytTR family, response regulator
MIRSDYPTPEPVGNSSLVSSTARSVDMISAMIVDDESIARARLRRLLRDEKDVNIVAEADNGADALPAILDVMPDLVFLDIEMLEGNALQVLKALPRRGMPIFVFVTANNKFALNAFGVDSLDYLVKPFDAYRFQLSMRWARRRLEATNDKRQLFAAIREILDAQRQIQAAVSRLPGSAAGTTRPKYLQRLVAKSDGRVFFVRAGDVDYIESAGNYIKLHVGPVTHLIRGTLGEIAARLDPAQFARIHRSNVVNLDKVREIQPWFSGDAVVILHTGQKLRLSRFYRESIDLGAQNGL